MKYIVSYIIIGRYIKLIILSYSNVQWQFYVQINFCLKYNYDKIKKYKNK